MPSALSFSFTCYIRSTSWSFASSNQWLHPSYLFYLTHTPHTNISHCTPRTTKIRLSVYLFECFNDKVRTKRDSFILSILNHPKHWQLTNLHIIFQFLADWSERIQQMFECMIHSLSAAPPTHVPWLRLKCTQQTIPRSHSHMHTSSHTLLERPPQTPTHSAVFLLYCYIMF